MAKIRIYAIARKLGIPTKELLEFLGELGMDGLKAVSTVSEDEAKAIEELIRERGGDKASPPAAPPKAPEAEEATDRLSAEAPQPQSSLNPPGFPSFQKLSGGEK